MVAGSPCAPASWEPGEEEEGCHAAPAALGLQEAAGPGRLDQLDEQAERTTNRVRTKSSPIAESELTHGLVVTERRSVDAQSGSQSEEARDLHFESGSML